MSRVKRNVIFLLSFWAFLGRGRRLQASLHELARHVGRTRSLRKEQTVQRLLPAEGIGSKRPSEVLPALLHARSPAAAFANPSLGASSPAVQVLEGESRVHPRALSMTAALTKKQSESANGLESARKQKKRVKLDVPLPKADPAPSAAPASVLDSSADDIERTLQSMKVADLKAFAKRLGLKPGTLRKAELVSLCANDLQATIQQKRSQSEADIADDPPREQAPTPDQSMGSERAPSHKVEGIISEVTQRTQALPTRKTLPRLVNADKKSEEGVQPRMQTGRAARRFPTGKLRDTRLEGIPGYQGADMEIQFLGTASCRPTIGRMTSCVSLHTKGYWLFDCGDGAFMSLAKTSIQPADVNKIFITHLHGDHSFGLGPMLCGLGQADIARRDAAREKSRARRDREPQRQTIEIYGPEGTRDLVRASLQLTYSGSAAAYRVHELKSIPSNAKRYTQKFQSYPDHHEIAGGLDIYPDEHGHYTLFEENGVTVKAAPMVHTVPCVGYVVQEEDQKGHLIADVCKEAINRNRVKLAQIYKDPFRAMKDLKALEGNESFTFPNGEVLRREDIMEPDRPGRKVVIMGDTSSGDHIEDLAKDADILVHEATNALLTEEDWKTYGNLNRLERSTIQHGHSSPQMAGDFAKRIGAKRLILTHFSPRYWGDDGERSMQQMWQIEDMARETSGLTEPNDVIAAWDTMWLPIKMK